MDSTELATRLDPEDLREVMGAYHRCAANVVERFEGHVAKYLGDGVVVYFGWPRAHEDDAERAVRAGLALVEAVREVHAGSGLALSARVGVATGQVVIGDLVGEGAARDEAIVGGAPALAAHLQTLAEPGTVVIGQATRRLVHGLFEIDDLGPQQLNGFAEPLVAWRIVGEAQAEGRLEARHSGGLTPLVGREAELALLLCRWRQASDGDGQVVLLSGEPGVDKSRLVRELRARLSEIQVNLFYQCSPHHSTSPLHPLIEQLERAAGFERNEPPAARVDKLETLLGRGTDRLDQAVPLIGSLLGLPIEDRYPPLDLTPQRQKQLTLEAIVDQLAGLAAAQPMLLVYEDVHWIDPTAQELLGLTIERIQRLPVLAVITFRPEFQPPWSARPHISTLALTRLSRPEGAAMVERMVGDRTLPNDVAVQIVAKTDGVPLFVEELTKTVLESALLVAAGDHYDLSGPLPPFAIPSTLHDSLLAPLDYLAPARAVAQIGAVIGRDFQHRLLALVATCSEKELERALAQLVDAELIFRHGTPPEVTYSFKHALVRDTAYESLLKSRRRQLHGRVAEALAKAFPELVEAEPEVVADHYTAAGLIEAAIPYWRRAGERALQRSAHAEAAAHLSRALELLATLPTSAKRVQEELDLRLALGVALICAKSYSALEVGEVYARARDLCRKVGETPQLFPALRGLWGYYRTRADYRTAREVAERFLRMAERSRDGALLQEAHRVVGLTLFETGESCAQRSSTWGSAQAALQFAVPPLGGARHPRQRAARGGAGGDSGSGGALAGCTAHTPAHPGAGDVHGNISRAGGGSKIH